MYPSCTPKIIVVDKEIIAKSYTPLSLKGFYGFAFDTCPHMKALTFKWEENITLHQYNTKSKSINGNFSKSIMEAN